MCCSKNFIKRILPFFLTFAVGLFIASFFITIAAPRLNFSVGRGERFRQHQRQDEMMRVENERLKAENFRLKMDAADRNEDLSDATDFSDDILVPSVPAPPAAPKNFRR